MRANHSVISLILLGMILMSIPAGRFSWSAPQPSTMQMSLNPIQTSWLDMIYSTQAFSSLIACQLAVTSGGIKRLKYRQIRQKGAMTNLD